MNPCRIALSGYYGCGNAGDEAVLAGIRDGFRRRAGDRVVLTALSQQPEDTRALHGIEAAPRMDIHVLRQVIGSSDLLISGGGSLLQDTTSFKSLLYYLFVMRIAMSRKVPFMLYAQGLGPLRRGLSRRLVRMTVQRAAAITVRDTGSAELLREIGVDGPRIEVTADPAFALEPADPALIDDAVKRERIPDDSIGVALRPWGDAAGAPLAQYRELLKQLESQTGRPCVMLPMHHPDDLDFARTIVDGSHYPIIQGACSPNLVLGLVSRLSMVVAMRLHSLIFAACADVPMFALTYDPKVDQLMSRLGLAESVADWKAFNPYAVAAHAAATLTTREAAVATLQSQTRELEAAALRNCDVAMGLLGLS